MSLSQCDGDQRCTFVLLNSLMDHELDPVMPTSSSDDELASHFSNFFGRRSLVLGVKLTRLLLIEFSVDFPLYFTRSLTFAHFRLVTEANVLRYMRETRKTCCSL